MKNTPLRTFEDFFSKGDQYFLRHLSIDCVIFGFHQNELKVLLLESKELKGWCLPGGFVLKSESLDNSAVRILKNRTGLDDIYLRQFHTFGDAKRDWKSHGFKTPKGLRKDSWIMERFISVGYCALVDFSKAVPTPDVFSLRCEWRDIDDIPRLILDHNEIVLKALESLRQHLGDYPIGRDLLPKKFTMPELQRLYETILGRALDRRNFQKKILSLGILDRLKERKTGGAHKAPFLYKFNQKKYQKALKQGIKFGL